MISRQQPTGAYTITVQRSSPVVDGALVGIVRIGGGSGTENCYQNSYHTDGRNFFHINFYFESVTTLKFNFSRESRTGGAVRSVLCSGRDKVYQRSACRLRDYTRDAA